MAYHIYLNISIHKMDDVSCCPFEWFSVRPLCFLSLCTALIHRASQQLQLKEQGKKKEWVDLLPDGFEEASICYRDSQDPRQIVR